MNLVNTNIVGNQAGEGGTIAVVDLGDPILLTYSNAYDNGDTPFGDLPDPRGTAGNIGVDPRYADVASEDPTEWDLRLESWSDCIDAGDPTVLDSDGSTSDIGAYGGPYGSW